MTGRSAHFHDHDVRYRGWRTPASAGLDNSARRPVYLIALSGSAERDMPLYRVGMRGENFLMNLTGEPELLGFSVTYYIKAADEEEARRIGTIKVRKNRNINGSLMNTPENPTRLSCEEVKRVWFRREAHDGLYDFWIMDKRAEPGAVDGAGLQESPLAGKHGPAP